MNTCLDLAASALCELDAIVSQDIDEYQELAKQANADRLQLMHQKSDSAYADLEAPQPASASDPAIASLQPADFTLTTSVTSTTAFLCF
jgi:hypothetical protein